MEITLLGPEPDEATAERLAGIVNEAYAEGEKGLWRDGALRTSAGEMRELAAAGKLAVARRGDRILGCVRVQMLSPGVGQLGMLAADPAERGGGVGRELVRFAEEHARAAGAPVMQLELLVPLDGEHPVKEFLRGWYTRIGYRQTGTESLADDYPELSPLLAVPCQLVVFRKQL
ncbi:GNAT family N-acetyltransferase [Paractinoplanes atraurantiacus]|uniref:Acetyltransferase (GNAT) family protein n=1 Tax=Paractinoplanes atraurantiacus TaxID=1036182 RepID=A0A285HTP2_9ACTN|nr:GNAT family N-acetyltransferase [Actinoplanes atraurantiacus]SNY39037.1 Acetyltransferase (GNAT) family protein [Actinoplanes atraurantiacus]